MSTKNRLAKFEEWISTVTNGIEDKNEWLYVAPAMLIYVPFVIFPALFIVYLSIHSWDGLGELSYHGLASYQAVVSDGTFRVTLLNTGIVFVVNMIIRTFGALLVAIALKKAHDNLRNYFQIAILLPTSMMAVGIGLIWQFLYNPELGLINKIIETLGFSWQPLWLGDPSLSLISVILVSNWWWFGFWVIIWLVGLTSIDDKYYEAALIDGAGRIQTFRYITLPLLRETAIMVLILASINAIKSFAIYWVMTQGGPGQSSEVLLTWIYKLAFSVSDFGMASALTVIVLGIISVMTALNIKLTGGQGEAE